MCRSWGVWLVACSLLISGQQPEAAHSEDAYVMLAAVSREGAMLSGGLGPSRWTGRGTAIVEPLALLSQAGDWKDLPCGPAHQDGCRKFAREYLNKSHSYTVISADGNGAIIHAAPATVDECFNSSGPGTYSGAALMRSAVAASSAEWFEDAPPIQLVGKEQSQPIRQALVRLAPKRFESLERLRYYTVRLEGQDLIVVQRTYPDVATSSERFQLIFAIGRMEQGSFHILHWKKNTEDEQESVFGTIRLRNGREFLVTVANDPETQSFRVYGIRNGQLVRIYAGGGSSC